MSKTTCRNGFIFVAAMCLGLMVTFARGGSLDDTGAPTDPASAMYTARDIYNRLAFGTNAPKRAGAFTEPAAGPTSGTMPTMDDIMAKTPATNVDGAVDGAVLSGKTFWGLTQDAWGTRTGTIATVTLSPANDTVSNGYYEATTLHAVDPDLATNNIRSGVTIFGFAGNTNVVNTSSGNAMAGDVKSGQVAWVQGAAVTGTIATVTLSGTTTNMVAGYYAATNLAQVATNLATANIKAGMTIFGVAGKTEVVDTTSGNAGAGDVMSDKKAYVAGALVTGTIATRTLSTTNDTVDAGYYAATTLHAVDPDLATNNIRSGVTIFGVTGKTEVVDTTSGNAVASDVRSGQVAWVQGVAVTGTIETVTLSGTTTNLAAGYYAATNLAQVATNLATANIKAGITIFGVLGSNAVVDTTSGNAEAGDVISGKVAWVQGAAVTGTITTVTLSGTTTNMATGYYAATNLAQVATNLAAGNIKKDINIFGVIGAYESITNARVPKTGQTISYTNYDDGWYSTNKGQLWPHPRFSPVGASGDETNQIRDNLTGLIWARNANFAGEPKKWQAALDCIAATNASATLYGGTNDWRLPNMRELYSLIHFGINDPALCDTEGTAQWTEGNPFTDVQADQYWTSSAYSPAVDDKWYVKMSDGEVSRTIYYGGAFYVWPVRGP